VKHSEEFPRRAITLEGGEYVRVICRFEGCKNTTGWKLYKWDLYQRICFELGTWYPVICCTCLNKRWDEVPDGIKRFHMDDDGLVRKH